MPVISTPYEFNQDRLYAGAAARAAGEVGHMTGSDLNVRHDHRALGILDTRTGRPPLLSSTSRGCSRKVWKFGGTSLGDMPRLRAVAERLAAAQREGVEVVAVLSAMGHSTDALVAMAADVSGFAYPREMDALLAVGEVISCTLVAMAIQSAGGSALSMSGAQAGIHTDHTYGLARLQAVEIDAVEDALRCGRIPVVTGFQGISDDGDVTTLGRGGSDASAIILAAALGLSECEIFTDVDAVYTADPRVVTDAIPIPELSHDDMLHLADSGAQVLQPRAVELAQNLNIDIHVCSSFTTACGTWIRKETPVIDTRRVNYVAHRSRDPIYTLRGATSSSIVARLASRDIAVGAIVDDGQSVRFTVAEAEEDRVAAALGPDAKDLHRDDLGSVSVVGTGVWERCDAVTDVIKALDSVSVETRLVTTSPHRISCHVPTDAVPVAVGALHDVFVPERRSPAVNQNIPVQERDHVA